MPRICSVDTSPLLYFCRMDQQTLDSRPVSGHGVTFLRGNDEKITSANSEKIGSGTVVNFLDILSLYPVHEISHPFLRRTK